jgi:hypothetical protein
LLVLTINASAASRVLLISKVGNGALAAALAEEKNMRQCEESVTATKSGIGRCRL